MNVVWVKSAFPDVTPRRFSRALSLSWQKRLLSVCCAGCDFCAVGDRRGCVCADACSNRFISYLVNSRGKKRNRLPVFCDLFADMVTVWQRRINKWFYSKWSSRLRGRNMLRNHLGWNINIITPRFHERIVYLGSVKPTVTNVRHDVISGRCAHA